MPWKKYNTHVRVGPAAGGVVLPVTNLEVIPEPWVGSGDTVVTLFDGRRRLENITWGYRVELSWDELRTDQADLQAAIVYLLSNDGADLYVEHLGDGVFDGTKIIPATIPQLKGGEIAARFTQRARRRPGNLSLLTKSQQLPLYTWITL